MQNYLLLKETEEITELSKQLGFSSCKFLGTIKGETKKQLLKETNSAKGVKTYKPLSEDLLRFALEKTTVDIIYGMENINYKDSMHYVRGGLDQVTCKIAAERGKTIAFSFSEILNSSKRGQLLARMRLNIKLCQKYKVNIIFGNFSSSEKEMRSKEDLQAFLRMLSKEK